jgi:hypothetical protein
MSQTQVDLILDGSVVTADIADSAVTTAKIANANVTTAKIADASITQAKLAVDVSFSSPFTTKGFNIPL